MSIDRINLEKNIDELVEVIRESFMTVAGEFDITKENAPTNPAFIDSLAVERSVGGKKQIILATSRKIN